MNNIQEVKAIEQSIAREALSKNKGTGIIAMCTGGGKTKIGIDEVVDEYKKKPGKDILWIVPFAKLRDKTVEAEFDKWALGEKKPEIICYASMKNYANKHYSLVVLDEAHHLTETRSDFFKLNKVDRIVGLTATPPHEIEKQIIFQELGLKVIYSLSLDEGVKKGVVAPYHIYVHYVKLYDKPGHVIVNAGGVETHPSEKDIYKKLSDYIDSLKNKNYRVPKMLYLQRSQLIYNLASKTHYTQKLLTSLDSNNRRLVFCGSIKQAEYLCKHTYHSETNDKDLEAFMKEEINELGVVQALNEGQNIDNLDEAVIVQLNSNPRHVIQRIGRIVRYRENHKASIHIIIAQDTRDEDWLRTALSKIDPSNITYYEKNK